MQVSKPVKSIIIVLAECNPRISPPPHQLLEFVVSGILPIGANMKNIHLGLVKVLKDSFVLPANHTIVKKHN